MSADPDVLAAAMRRAHQARITHSADEFDAFRDLGRVIRVGTGSSASTSSYPVPTGLRPCVCGRPATADQCDECRARTVLA